MDFLSLSMCTPTHQMCPTSQRITAYFPKVRVGGLSAFVLDEVKLEDGAKDLSPKGPFSKAHDTYPSEVQA
jgi:hypothetical protein